MTEQRRAHDEGEEAPFFGDFSEEEMSGPNPGQTSPKKSDNATNGLDDVHNVHLVHEDPLAAAILAAAIDPENQGEEADADTADPPAQIAKAVAIIEDALAEPDQITLGERLFRKDFTMAAQTLRGFKDLSHWMRLLPRITAAKPKGITVADIKKATRPAAVEDEGNVADSLVAMAREKAELFHSQDGNCFATLREALHATFNPDSREWGEFLSFSYYQKTRETQGLGRAASQQALKTAGTTITGLAKHEGPEREAFLRAAKCGECYYIDLGTPTWEAIEISAAGWKVIQNPPVVFWRTATMKALPIPLPPGQGNLDLLWEHINVATTDQPLIVAWILESWRPDRPFPVLELCGTQGSAKSSTQERLRTLIDNNAINLRAAPKSVEDFFVSANLNWLTSLNNLSHLSGAHQDALCSLATGGGYAARTLFHNLSETAYEAKRPVVLNSIVPCVTNQDLSDRVIHLELPALPRYRTEGELAAAFEADAPAIMSGLLDLFAAALARLPGVTITRPPRMSDFAFLGEAITQAQGQEQEFFLKLYRENRRSSIARGLDASPVAAAIRAMCDAYNPKPPDGLVFNGLMSNLLEQLGNHRTIKSDTWPKSPRGLGDVLRRQKPALADIGILVEILPRTNEGIKVKIIQKDAEGQ